MHALFLVSATPKYPALTVLMGKSALLFVPLHNHRCLDTPHMRVCALWSSLEQQNFSLSARGLSFPVTNAKVSQTLRTGPLPVTPDVLRFQQIANWHQQQQGSSAASPARLVPRRELPPPSEGSTICRISRNSLSCFPFPHRKWEQLLRMCM